MIAGRGNAFFDAYLQFGQSLDDSRERFSEHLALLLRLWRESAVNFEGDFRAPPAKRRCSRALQRPRAPTCGSGAAPPLIPQRSQLRLACPCSSPACSPARPPSSASQTTTEHSGQTRGSRAPRIGYTAHCLVGADGDAAREEWAPWHLGYLTWWELICAQSGHAGPPPVKDRHAAYEDPSLPLHSAATQKKWLIASSPGTEHSAASTA